MENAPQLLTVATLIKDLQNLDQNAEVAVCMESLPVTIPIRSITNAQAQYEDGTPKAYVLMMVSHTAIKNAIELMEAEATAHKSVNSILQLN